MIRSCKSIYVTSYRWMFRNFGQGKLPQFKSLFNVSFLLIIALTTAMLVAQLVLRSGWVAAGTGINTIILFGAVFFMMANYLVLLNNRWMKRLNDGLAHISKHNMNTLSIIVLLNVIIICSLILATVR
ncbi:MAG: hypothetical protein JO080_13315 [Mucilaginibacter sp.]|nr:hypothetical protein [Mucilaginibacter sp.]